MYCNKNPSRNHIVKRKVAGKCSYTLKIVPDKEKTPRDNEVKMKFKGALVS